MADENNKSDQPSAPILEGAEPPGASPTPPATQPAEPGKPPAIGAKPEWLDAQYWDDKTGFKKDAWAAERSELEQLRTLKAQHDVRLSGVPEAPDKYELKLPADFKAPEGVELKLDPDDPLVVAFRDFAHKNQLTQEQFETVAGLYAQQKVEEMAWHNKRINEEREKLGGYGKAKQRIEALQMALKPIVGEAGIKTMFQFMWTADAVQTAEKLARALVNGGGGGVHPTTPSGARGSENALPANWNEMSVDEKFAYGRELQRKQQNGAQARP